MSEGPRQSAFWFCSSSVFHFIFSLPSSLFPSSLLFYFLSFSSLFYPMNNDLDQKVYTMFSHQLPALLSVSLSLSQYFFLSLLRILFQFPKWSIPTTFRFSSSLNPRSLNSLTNETTGNKRRRKKCSWKWKGRRGIFCGSQNRKE